MKNARFSFWTLVGLVVDWVLARGKPRHHWRRYVLAAVLSVGGIFCLCAAYLLLLPKTYASEWAIILPGSSVDARVSLDRIGQAQISSSSPFSDKALSPKVNYKEIASSRPVLKAAAGARGLDVRAFPKPRIKLIDQTSIIEFKVYGSSPEDAQANSWALYSALLDKLTDLRQDEIKRRNTSVKRNIVAVETNLKAARKKLLDLQMKTGLASLEQYRDLISGIETLRRDIATVKANVAETRNQLSALTRSVGTTPEQAGQLLLVNADPVFRKLWQTYALASSKYAENASRFGAQNPRVSAPRQQMQSIRHQIDRLFRSYNLEAKLGFSELLLKADNQSYLRMLSQIMERQSQLSGLTARVTELKRLLQEQEKRRERLGHVAAQLDDLQRDHLVANAVFTSAVAQIDTVKSDIYASYPLVQLLEEPTVPTKPSSPRPIFAVIGGLAGSLLAVLGWTFAWLHQWFAWIRLRNASFTMQYA